MKTDDDCYLRPPKIWDLLTGPPAGELGLEWL
jgi:hypothetical protein